MGGANGSRECAPDDKRRYTHHLHFMEMMGFAGSTHPASSSVIPGCAAWRRPGIHTPGRGYGFRARAPRAPE
jgi:hypothetical protein